MANVMTGTFVLLSALSADAAIDVRGAHEQAGTEIWMYRRKGGISQIWSVLDQGTGALTWSLRCPGAACLFIRESCRPGRMSSSGMTTRPDHRHGTSFRTGIRCPLTVRMCRLR